ncbi:Sporulation domain-containing protein [Crenothrix polyspora]|uniref:Sporulation domain-containing protein n=1 Tax=Crenothrix polyspora TaxID=360316 RepID=A0A1R4H8Y1_9GAMM|nr:SPOR domain-containing protein [Crenothrix polyspora]SJM92481.1 Sporulation domain-containing protein [Crenothrix polyspora]
MARDYKHRAQNNKNTNTPYKQRAQANSKIGPLKWMLITALVISFAVFLVYLRSMDNKPGAITLTKTLTTADLAKIETQKKAEPEPKKEPQPPQFDFYTILPQKEMVVADHEIKTRAREERVGKTKNTHYVIQAGSFKSSKEADQLRAKLALMGIESKINKAKVGDVIWYRVKIGPYARLDSVKTVMSRLKQNDMKPVVTEIENLD